MRALSLAAVAAVAPLAACLDKPGRPPGDVADAAPDANVLPPTTVFRKYSYAVADLDSDGYDDLLRWGNVARGGSPRVWVTMGSDAGPLGSPNYEIDVGYNATRAWYEVLDVAVDDIDPASTGPELLVLTGEDDGVPNGPSATGRHLIAQVFSNPVGGGSLRGRATPLDGYDVGGVANDPFPVYIVGRRTSALGQSIVFGGLDHNMFRIDNLTPPDYGVPIPSLLLDGGTAINGVQDLFDVDAPDGDEQLVAVTDGVAWHSDGDPVGDTYNGPSTPLPDSGERSVLPLYQSPQPFMAAATLGGSTTVQVVVDELPPTALARYALTLDPPAPTYIAIGYIGGTGAFDIAALAGGRLKVYRDLRLDASGADPVVIADAVVGGPADLAGYDLVVIGNFSGLAGTEIYALGDIDHPPRCMTMSAADTIEYCP